MVRADQVAPELPPDPGGPRAGRSTARTLRGSRLLIAKRSLAFFVFSIVAVWCCCASAQDNAAQEAARRAAVLAHLPPDAAQRAFGAKVSPAAGPPEAIGAYERGCLEGAVALPADGPNWQVMRPSRNRAWGHPVLIALLERVAPKLPAAADWPGLLIGDIAQPRGGPMLTGHGSHQIGLDADIWLTPMPGHRLSVTERDAMSATDLVAADGNAVDDAWTP